MTRIPARYRDLFVEVIVDGPPVVMTSVGPRSALHRRWKCNHCGKTVKPNTAGIHAHFMLHVRQRGSCAEVINAK